MTDRREVRVQAGRAPLAGFLDVPRDATGIVLFAHGSGSSRHSSRNQYVARELVGGGLATLLFDLLTLEEEAVDLRTRHLRFDIDLLGGRVVDAVDWVATVPGIGELPVGLFGASTGAAAALIAAAERPDRVRAVVSRGGRPDLAGDALERVRTPTLFLVGGDDVTVIGLNEQARARMPIRAELEIVPGASHLFEEPGTLEQAAALARRFFQEHLGAARREQIERRV